MSPTTGRASKVSEGQRNTAGSNGPRNGRIEESAGSVPGCQTIQSPGYTFSDAAGPGKAPRCACA